jgi:bifunctional NMN adenylyltransferase/nudix hydrolase
MTKQGIFIGRFQPIHQGHVHALGIAASQVDKLYIFVGSANACRSIKNPWTYTERADMIRKKMRSTGINNIEIIPINDHPYSDSQWIADVRATVEHLEIDEPILFGHMKEGNNYLNWFPDWKFKNIEATYNINATAIRKRMFETEDSEMPSTVLDDYKYYQKENALFANYPFPETLNFNCSDAVLECQGHVLLIKRKFAPGAGTWALPGGFRNQRETFLSCAIRELQEETNVRVPEKVLRGSIVKTELFDDPSRSFGIPRNSLAVYMRINPDPDGGLPRANGADDAAECKWIPLTDALNRIELYDDHKAIISKVTGVMPMPAFVTLK